MISSQLSLTMSRAMTLFFKNITRASGTIITSLSRLLFLASCLCTVFRFSSRSLSWALWTITDGLQTRCSNSAFSRSTSSLREWSEVHLWVRSSIRNFCSRRWRTFMISFVILSNRTTSRSRSNSESMSCLLKRLKNNEIKIFQTKEWKIWRSRIDDSCSRSSKTITWRSSKENEFLCNLANSSETKLSIWLLIMKISSMIKTLIFLRSFSEFSVRNISDINDSWSKLSWKLICKLLWMIFPSTFSAAISVKVIFRVISLRSLHHVIRVCNRNDLFVSSESVTKKSVPRDSRAVTKEKLFMIRWYVTYWSSSRSKLSSSIEVDRILICISRSLCRMHSFSTSSSSENRRWTIFK